MVTTAAKLKDACCRKESYNKPRQRIKKQTHHVADKGPYIHSNSFSHGRVQRWELNRRENWVPKNWCFWAVVLEKTLESSWTARRSNQSILKEINLESSLEGLLLKLQYFGHLMHRADSLEKTLMLGKIVAGKIHYIWCCDFKTTWNSHLSVGSLLGENSLGVFWISSHLVSKAWMII